MMADADDEGGAAPGPPELLHEVSLGGTEEGGAGAEGADGLPPPPLATAASSSSASAGSAGGGGQLPTLRRQGDMVREAEQGRGACMTVGDTMFLIATEWWERWTDAAHYDLTKIYHTADGGAAGEDGGEGEDPEQAVCAQLTPISNEEHLLEKGAAAGQTKRLRPHMQERRNFVFVTEASWRLLHGWYGGLAIARKVIEVNFRPFVEVYPLTLTLQRAGPSPETAAVNVSRDATLKQLKELAIEELRLPSAAAEDLDSIRLSIGSHGQRLELTEGDDCALYRTHIALDDIIVVELLLHQRHKQGQIQSETVVVTSGPDLTHQVSTASTSSLPAQYEDEDDEDAERERDMSILKRSLVPPGTADAAEAAATGDGSGSAGSGARGGDGMDSKGDNAVDDFTRRFNQENFSTPQQGGSAGATSVGEYKTLDDGGDTRTSDEQATADFVAQFPDQDSHVASGGGAGGEMETFASGNQYAALQRDDSDDSTTHFTGAGALLDSGTGMGMHMDMGAMDTESGYGAVGSSTTVGAGRPRNSYGNPRGVLGFMNLGNTCFMNSALQCLSNTPPLRDYFLTGKFAPEINESNPLGTGGELARVFGDLMFEVWGDTPYSSIAPREFKYVLGKHAEQFMGYDQHDSQEFIAYLLDGIHEDVNRVESKPYVESVEAKEEETHEETADRAWQAHLQRNNSHIVDLFQGQYHSVVTCPEGSCDRVSTTFDPFMYLTLPLPNSNKKQQTITVITNDAQIPLRFVVTVPKSGSLRGVAKEAAKYLTKRLRQQKAQAAKAAAEAASGDGAAESGESSEVATAEEGGNETESQPQEQEAKEVEATEEEIDAHDFVFGEFFDNAIYEFFAPQLDIDRLADNIDLFLFQLPPHTEEEKQRVAQRQKEKEMQKQQEREAAAEQERQNDKVDGKEAAEQEETEDASAGEEQQTQEDKSAALRAKNPLFWVQDLRPFLYNVQDFNDCMRSAERLRNRLAEFVSDGEKFLDRVADTADMEEFHLLSLVNRTHNYSNVSSWAELETFRAAIKNMGVWLQTLGKYQKEYVHVVHSVSLQRRERKNYYSNNTRLVTVIENIMFPAFSRYDAEHTTLRHVLRDVARASVRFIHPDRAVDESDKGEKQEQEADGDDSSDDNADAPETAQKERKEEEAEQQKSKTAEQVEQEIFDLLTQQEIYLDRKAPRTNAYTHTLLYRPLTEEEQRAKAEKEQQAEDAADGGNDDDDDVEDILAGAFGDEEPAAPAPRLGLDDLIAGELLADDRLSVRWPASARGTVLDEKEADRLTEDSSQASSGGVGGRNRFARKSAVNIMDCLHAFLEKEQLEETELWYCNKCTEHRQAWKELGLWRTPPILIIHIKRFQMAGEFLDKLDDPVNFPLEGLDLTDYVLDKRDVEKHRPVYDLLGVVNHYGGYGGGHYTAYARSQTADGAWYEFDDAYTREIQPHEVVTDAAYVLFYLRKDLMRAATADAVPEPTAPMAASTTGTAGAGRGGGRGARRTGARGDMHSGGHDRMSPLNGYQSSDEGQGGAGPNTPWNDYDHEDDLGERLLPSSHRQDGAIQRSRMGYL